MIRAILLFPAFSRYTKWALQAWILVSNEKHCSGSDAVAPRSRYSVSAVTTKSSNHAMQIRNPHSEADPSGYVAWL
jgi:hypothetical protein